MTIPGYRKLTEDEVKLVADNKFLEEKVLQRLDRLAEIGFMLVNQSVTQPDRVDV